MKYILAFYVAILIISYVDYGIIKNDELARVGDRSLELMLEFFLIASLGLVSWMIFGIINHGFISLYNGSLYILTFNPNSLYF